ncbi:MAG: Verru_Chthon cassette protein C [Verrucomicrobiota bacterium]
MRPQKQGFTLVELMLATAIFSIIVLVLATLIARAQETYSTVTRTADQFRPARLAFELITSRIEQATLNTYWDYDDLDNPTKYVRQSDLHFIAGPADGILQSGSTGGHAVFFQAPLGITSTRGLEDDPYEGMESLLNSWGYYLDYGNDVATWPPFLRGQQGISKASKWRLMEFRKPTEELDIYDLRNEETKTKNALYQWVSQSAAASSKPIAENIIALVIQPRTFSRQNQPDSEIRVAPEYLYDSREFEWGGGANIEGSRINLTRNQLPPILDVSMVALAEASVSRYLALNGEDALRNVIPNGLFSDSRDYESDLETLQGSLDDEGLEYQLFSTTVLIRASKWSEG